MKACYVVLCAVICIFAHSEIGRAELIDFDDLVLSPSEALLITNQYQHLGVLFSGEGSGSGLVYREGYYGTANFGNSSPNIMDMGWRNEATIATFVIPGTITPTVATNVSVLTGDGNPDSETFTVESFDLDGNPLFSQTYTTTVSGQLIQFSGEVASIRFVVEPGAESGACLDDLSFTVIPATTLVDIDIKPGSYPNSINPNAAGVIPVAILTTADFDASTVDPETVALEGAGARGKGKSGRYGSMEDVDGDGDLDLVVQIENDIEWDPEATEATLTGLTWDGTPIEGSDCIRLVPDDDNNGDQMWVGIEFVPHAQMQTDTDGDIAFYTGFGISLWDDSLYAYNQGARSAIITGPGLPVAGQVLEHYYPEPIFRLYPKGAWGHPSGGWGLWLDDTAISAIPDNAVYTIGIYKETADTVSLSDTPLKSYTKTFAKGPVLNSELNASLFPALITPSSHDESVLNIPGLVEVSWTNPSNMAVDWTTLGLHSLSTGYQISTDVTPGDTSATLDTTSLPSDVRANHLYMHGTDIYERRFGFGWDLFSQ